MVNGNNANVVQTILELPDLMNNMLLLLSDKEKVVINKRFSLGGNGKHTLEDIGQEFAVTRERVRQIEKSALAKMRRNVFNSTLRYIHEFVGDCVNENGGIMNEEKLVEALIDVMPANFAVDKSSIHLALNLHEKLECVGNTINFHPYVRDKSISDYSLKYASGQLVNQMYRYGNIKSIEKVHNDLKDTFEGISFDLTKIKSLIEIDKRLTLLDNELVGLLEWRHVNPRTLRDKIMYILRGEKKPMHFTEIADRISSAKFDGRSVNMQAVHNELIRHDQFVLIGRGIYALKEWGFESGTVAAVIEAILADKKELSQDEIIEQVLKQRQVKRITIMLALKDGGKFERVGRKVYKLRK
ncbi:hypothetical protein COY05_02705 [Candidatus Peregrinibacteria bacterium CG_4_10_14_0_2_um_filter_38_24]|nr:MAG: hypothetical protein COY05_02705 [Candidatus Peregrinibacteria bacterium CG_4_10_14_0_2_um_filter_38_24]PJC38636.1 MAG: hypothetical protein CO044_03935 [Candidatus Peregrinibacteria bacterium CG_4_9_14_0_2_um_filter_38_9]